MNTIRNGWLWPATLIMAVLAAVTLIVTAMPLPAHAQDAGAELRAFEKRVNEGMAKGDYDYAASLQAQDGIRVHPLAGVIRGREALRNYFAMLAKGWAHTKETITWMVANGNHVAAAITFHATNRKTGKSVNVPMALLADFNSNGMIKWSRIYFNAAVGRKAKR